MDIYSLDPKGRVPESAVLIKMDATGETAWKQVYEPDALDFTWIGSDVVQGEDGGYFMTGVKTCVWNCEETGGWLLKTDDTGEWMK